MQPSKFDQSKSEAVQTSKPAKPAHPKWLRVPLKIFSPLMRLPLFGGLGRTTWLILAVAALAVFVAGSFWARTTAIDATPPARYSRTWWFTSVEFHRELQLASLGDQEIESIAVVRTAPGKDRVFIAGRNALLAFSDDAGHTWTKLNYDPLMGGFAVAGKRAPFPDTSGISQTASQGAPASTTAATPATTGQVKKPAPSPRQQQNSAPVNQYPPQKQTTPALKLNPAPTKPGARKPAASLSFLSSLVPSVWAVEKPPQVQPASASGGQTISQSAAVLGVTGGLQPQPQPDSITAICLAADGTLVLVMSGDRGAVSSDFGETWRATSLGALIKPPPGDIGLIASIGGKELTTGKFPVRLKTWDGRPSRAWLGDTLLYSYMLEVTEPQQFLPGATYRVSASSVWAISDSPKWKLQTGPAGAGYVNRYYTDAQGSRWVSVISAFPVGLWDVAFSTDGTTGYIVGMNGTILRTRNGGASWQPLTREALHPGQSLSAASAAGSYWRLSPPWTYPLLILFLGSLFAGVFISAVPGANGLAEVADWLSSSDQPSDQPSRSDGGVALVTVSDRPLGEDDVDSLGFCGIARGVAGFLRNPKTQLPVTLAINGAWGTGKSSLMNLISGELRRAGFRPVWFNAWHHQEDENLLASLLQSVRAEASPSLLREGGLAFRFRLGWFRFSRFYPRALAMVAIFIGLWAAESWYDNATFLQHFFADTFGSTAETQPAAKPQSATPAQSTPSGAGQQAAPAAAAANSAKPEAAGGTAANNSRTWFAMLTSFLESLHKGSDDVATAFKLPRPLAALYFVFQILPAALQKLKSFSVNPASLLHSAAPGVPQKEIEAQTSFRMQFAKEFADVTRALGEKHRLVIFVDDLDRCKPANVAEMMEAINYVTVAGECAFVLGIETEAVRAALGLSFSAMAQELESANPLNGAADPAKTPAANPLDTTAVERRKRLDFACRYIEKLINIEMNVPVLDEKRMQALFTVAQPAPPANDPYERARKIVKAGRMLEPAAVFLLVLALGWGAGRSLIHLAEWQARDYYQDKLETTSAAAQNTPGANSPAPVSAASPSPVAVSPASAAAPAAGGNTPDVLAGEDPMPAAIFQTPPAWVVIGILLTIVIKLLTQEPIPPAKDSQEFTLALSAWGLIASTGLRTPRSTKRFLNRLRFLAMRQLPPAVQLPGLMRLLLTAEQEKEAVKREEAKAAGALAKDPIPEAILVALASLETCSKAAGSAGLVATDVGALIQNLSKVAVQSVLQGDFHHAFFLAELYRLATPPPPSEAVLNDDKSLHYFFDPFVKGRGLDGLVNTWVTPASAKISAHLDRYFDLGGDVIFT